MSQFVTLQLGARPIASNGDSAPAPNNPLPDTPTGLGSSAARTEAHAGERLRVVASQQTESVADTLRGTGDPFLLHWDFHRTQVRSVTLSDAAPLLAQAGEPSYAGEEYRIVRTKIVQLLKKPFRLAITSPSVGDGKTLTAVNLATALALTGEGRTLLIDADLRRANVHKRLRTSSQPGLTDVLRGASSLQNAIFQTEQIPDLYVLPAGEPDTNIGELLHSPRWRELGSALASDFPQMVVDCPPVDLFADYDLIAAICSAVLLVVRPDHTDRALLSAALDKLKAKLAGILINAAEDSIFNRKSKTRYHRYYDGYRKDRDDEKK